MGKICTLYDGILVRNVESYQFIKISLGKDFNKSNTLDVLLDHNLYTFNGFAKKFWQKNGAPSLTAHIELNKKKLKDLGIEDMEFLVYGYIPTMVSAQCVKRISDRCQRDEADVFIRDRMEVEFIVKKYCDFCYNIVYNSVPLYLFREMKEIRRLKPGGLRVSFTTEKKMK